MKNMVSKWIQDDRTIILAVVAANVDIATQEILAVSYAMFQKYKLANIVLDG